jgi:cobalt-zinc-cadmium resistance protein CzcA
MPVYVKDLAHVQFGYAPRYGAMTRNGQGETVGGVVLMMKGENSMRVIKEVKERITKIEQTLPKGVSIDVFVDRSKLISNTISTVEHNLELGALIVIFILVLMLGNLRAGLIVASVIPLSMLFAIILMNAFGMSANLMSMGALDFGLIVDGAVIIVESMMFLLHDKFKNAILNQEQMDNEVISSSSKIMNSAVFGQFIILIVYIPIFALVGIEGKMFQPMALTVSFAIIGALLLSLTYIPLMSSLFLDKNIKVEDSWSDQCIRWLQTFYRPSLIYFLKHRIMVLITSLLLLIGSVVLFNAMGGEFIPELDEGDFATNYTIRQGSSLSQTIEVGNQLENILLKNFHEVKEIVSKIGTSEIPTDPMPIESADLIIVLKDKKEWTSARDKEELAVKMSEKLSVIPGVNLSFEQPIQMRFNELIAGVKSDIAIKIYGDNLDVLFSKGNETAKLISGIKGATDIKVEQIIGMPQLVVKWNRDRIAQFGLNITDVNKVLNTALAGGKAGVVYEGEKKFDLVVRYADYHDADIPKVKNIFVPLADGTQIPISQLADVSFKSAPAQISRENGERRIVIEANVRNRDIQSVAEEISKTLNKELMLPSGYFIEYGGTFENLQEAKGRLTIAVPLALFLIFFLLFLTFRSVKESLIIFSAIPLAAIGGIVALWISGMNFSISAGIGFIALFGVSVLNGIVLIAYFNRLEQEGESDITQRILKGTAARLRPVLATASVASLGFLPMALSTSAGSEIQKPLATVVIGGLISSTLLTLIILPVLYSIFSKNTRLAVKGAALGLALLFSTSQSLNNITAQNKSINFDSTKTTVLKIGLDSCIKLALRLHPSILGANYSVLKQEELKKTSFTVDPVSIQYQGGQINGNKKDYNINVVTGIQNPFSINNQIKLQNSKVELARSQVKVNTNELIQKVSLAYYQLVYGNQRLRLFTRLDSIYSEFATYANKKFQLGESNLLEKITAEAQLKKIQLERRQSENELLIYQTELQQYIGTNSPIEIPDNEFNNPGLVIDTNSISINENSLYELEKQQVNVSIAELNLEKSKWGPALQFGAFNQSIDNTSPYWGWIVGAAIPIFKSGKTGRVNAAVMQTKITQSEFEIFKLNFNAAYQKAKIQYRQCKDQLDYYNNEGLKLANTLLNVSIVSYKSGDISYVEFIQGITQAFEIQNNYYQALNNYNLSIINLNYFLSK